MFGMSPTDLLDLNEKIQAFMPKIKELLPQLKSFEEIEKKKLSLKPNEMLLYTAMFTNTKLFIFVFRSTVISKTFEVEGEVFPENSIIIKEEIKKFELMQFVDQIEREGIVNLVSEIMTNTSSLKLG